MEYPELALSEITSNHINVFLDSFDRAIQSIPELASLWSQMDEAEQFDFRMDFSRTFGLRRLLGELYRAAQLSPDQASQLARLDRDLLAHAAGIEIIYSLTLAQLIRNLSTWGTPLTDTPETLHIVTTSASFAEMANLAEYLELMGLSKL